MKGNTMDGFAHMRNEAQVHPHATIVPSGTILLNGKVQVEFQKVVKDEDGVTHFMSSYVTLTLMQWHEANNAVNALIEGAIESGEGMLTLHDLAEAGA